MWAASVRHLWHRPSQLLLALAGLALGVATITAVDLATASSQRAFELSVGAVSGAASEEITGGPAGLDEKLYVELTAAYPQLSLAPIVEGYVAVGDEALDLVGIDPLASAGLPAQGGAAPAVAGAPLAELGRWLTESGAVVMASDTAARLGLTPNVPFELEVSGKRVRAVTIAQTTGSAAGTGTLLLTDIAQAQEWLGLVGRLTRIEIGVPAGAAGEAALGRLRAALPAGARLQAVSERTRSNLEMTRAFTTNLRAMSLLALLVGLFLIYGAVSFAVLQRRRTLGILRALGATRAQLLSLIAVEAVVLGCAGALLGVAVGAALAHALLLLVSRTINDLYFVVAVTTVSLTAATVTKALCAGVLTALAAALVPAVEASHAPPQLGLRRSALEARATGLSRALVPASAALAGAAGLLTLMSDRSLLAGFASLFLLLLSVAALTPALLGWCARRAAPLAGARSAVVRLALADVAASLSRTGVAVASLGMAIAAMIGVSVMVASFRESLREWLSSTMRADIYVTAPGPGFARPERRLDPQVVAALLAVRGVEQATASRRVGVASAAGPITLDAVTLQPASRAGIPLAAGDAARAWRQFDNGAIFVAEPLAFRLRLAPGAHLVLTTATGPRAFEVAAVYREYGNDRGAVLLDRRFYRRWWGDDAVTSLGLNLSPGTSAAAVLPALHAAARGHQTLLIGTNAELRALSLSIFDRTFVITRVLNWIAAGVAAIGLVSALMAWQLERAHDLAILRALGLTPRAAAALIEAQTGFMGLVALVAAIPAGIATAVLLVEVINRRAFGWRIDLHLHGAQLLNALVLAIAAALVAGLYPAWRTFRGAIAGTMREE
jgi:putative ABC transport system permease protein